MTLLEEIREISREAAIKLERAGCCSDSDIRTLTQYDLQELAPGLSKLKIRNKIYETIHKKRPIRDVLNELRSFIPDEFLRDALCSNGALHEYLQTLKELKVKITHVQEFLDAHIDLLENISQNQGTNSNEDQALATPVNHSPAASSSKPATSSDQMDYLDQLWASSTNHKEYHFNTAKNQASSLSSFCNNGPNRITQQPAIVKYKMVVSGKTLNRHLDVMGKLKGGVQGSLNLQETQSDEDSQVIIVFCPVVSRAGTDVETALQKVSEAKPVILVMMHHSHNVQKTLPILKPSDYKVLLVVNIFFHETVPGLMQCPQNDQALVSIQATLQCLNTKK